jgi:hypothetical protein
MCIAQRVERVDRVGLRLDKGSVTRHKNGFVDIWGVATRSGVFVYDESDGEAGILREYRPREEVFSDASLQTLRGVPFTIDHPHADVDKENVRELTHGWVLDVRVDGDLVRTQIRIASDEAQRAIKDGKIELSCGYTAHLDRKGGVTPAGERFDAIQRDIEYNHLALVDLARAGHVARLHFDSASRSLRVQSQKQGAPQMTMITLRHDGKAYKVPGFFFPGLKEAQEHRADAIETAKIVAELPDGPVELVLPLSVVEQMFGMVGAVEAPTAATPAEEPDPVDELPQEGAVPPEEEEEDSVAQQNPSRIDGAVIEKLVAKSVAEKLKRADELARERAGVERQAARILDSGYDYAGVDQWQVCLDVVTKIDSGAESLAKSLAEKARKGDERAAGRLLATFESAVKAARDRADSSGQMLGSILQMQGDFARADAATDPVEAARQRMIDRMTGKAPRVTADATESEQATA